MNRTVIVQLVLFAVMGLAAGLYVVDNVLGPQAFGTPMKVTVRLPDAAGLARESQVTYRGVDAGTVSSVDIDPDGKGVTLELTLDPGLRIPANTKAVISMDTPVAIQHVDLRPANDQPPYLTEGSVIQSQDTAVPLPLNTLLVHFMELADSVNPEDLRVLTDALATGLNGMGPELRQIMTNTQTLMNALRDNDPVLVNLLTNADSLLGAADGLPKLAAGMRRLTDQVRAQDPAIRSILDTGPGFTATLAPLMANNQQAAAALLGNLLTTSQIVSVRIPALKETMVALPKGLDALASTARGDTVEMYLVGAQGPVCFNDTDRRTPTDTAPRDPQLGWHCQPGPGLSQRGAMNAPRPVATYDPSTGQGSTPSGQQFTVGTGGGQAEVLGPRSWQSLFLQGVS